MHLSAFTLRGQGIARALANTPLRAAVLCLAACCGAIGDESREESTGKQVDLAASELEQSQSDWTYLTLYDYLASPEINQLEAAQMIKEHVDKLQKAHWDDVYKGDIAVGGATLTVRNSPDGRAYRDSKHQDTGVGAGLPTIQAAGEPVWGVRLEMYLSTNCSGDVYYRWNDGDVIEDQCYRNGPENNPQRFGSMRAIARGNVWYLKGFAWGSSGSAKCQDVWADYTWAQITDGRMDCHQILNDGQYRDWGSFQVKYVTHKH